MARNNISDYITIYFDDNQLIRTRKGIDYI